MITIISRTITRPLRGLEKTTRAIGQGDFAVKVPETGPREIKHLAQAFNRVGGQLTDYIAKRDFIRDTFGRYVTQEVVNKLMESQGGLELGGESRELTILMSDLRGFTALTTEMDPQRVIIFLNRYLGKMIEILMDHRGVIDEIIGDGLLAFFGAPEPMADHPEQAVVCALRMQAAMAEINAANEVDGFPYLEMGIAVNTGDVVVGNIGSERRTKYGIVGAQVNFTGRMESYSVGGQVLISPSTYDRLSHLVEVRDILQVGMKGVPDPVKLYDIRGIHGPWQITLPEVETELKSLTQPLSVRLYRIKNKIVTGTLDGGLDQPPLPHRSPGGVSGRGAGVGRCPAASAGRDRTGNPRQNFCQGGIADPASRPPRSGPSEIHVGLSGNIHIFTDRYLRLGQGRSLNPAKGQTAQRGRGRQQSLPVCTNKAWYS